MRELLERMACTFANIDHIVGRTIVDKNSALAIENLAALRGDLDLLEAILVREFDEASGLSDLEVPESTDEKQQRCGNQVDRKVDAGTQSRQLFTSHVCTCRGIRT